NARTQGELRRKEAGNVFGSGSRTPIAITLLVKKSNANKEKANIYYADIGDYLKIEDKLKILREVRSFDDDAFQMVQIRPNEHGDWISYRNDIFSSFIPMASTKKFDTKTKSF